MSLPNLSRLQPYAPPCSTGTVLTVEEVQGDRDNLDYAGNDQDDDGNDVMVCNLTGERFFQSSDPANLVVAIRLDDCGHVFHGSYLCTKVFGTEPSPEYTTGVKGLWNSNTGDWDSARPPLCDYCKRPFAFKNIRELIEKVDACDSRKKMGSDHYPRNEDDWKDQEDKYKKVCYAYMAKLDRQRESEEYQQRIGVAVARYRMDFHSAAEWAEQFPNTDSAEARAWGRAYRAMYDDGGGEGEEDEEDEEGEEGGERGERATLAWNQTLPPDYVASVGDDPPDMTPLENQRHFEDMILYYKTAKSQDVNVIRSVNEATVMAGRCHRTITEWQQSNGSMWWDCTHREIMRIFNRLGNDLLRGTDYDETALRRDLGLPKDDCPLSWFVEKEPKVKVVVLGGFGESVPDRELRKWREFYKGVMKTSVPYLFGAHKTGFTPGDGEQANRNFLIKYVAELGLSSIVLSRVKERRMVIGVTEYAWFLPHPSCWLSAPGDPSMAKGIDLRLNLKPEVVDGRIIMKAPGPDSQRHVFDLEYNHNTGEGMYKSRRCHMHVGIALNTPVLEAGVIYIRQVNDAASRCARGYKLHEGPPLIVTFSVPFHDETMPMAKDVVDFLQAYVRAGPQNRPTSTNVLNDLQSNYFYDFQRGGPTNDLPYNTDFLHPEVAGNVDGKQVYVLSCRMNGLRYQISAYDRRVTITVPIEEYLRNGIAVLLRENEPRGRIARAFGMGPRMQWQGTRVPSEQHNLQGVLTALLSNDIRPRLLSTMDWLTSTRRIYAIKGVVHGRTVVMRDRPRYKTSDGNVDQTDPSQTEALGVAHRHRERFPNIMACAELVLENRQNALWNSTF